MNRFEVIVQARHCPAVPGTALEVDGRTYTALSALEPLGPVAMPVSFEEAADDLQRLPRLLFEPDGSFVWVGEHQGDRWQIDGLLSDRAGRLIYAELKGNCPPDDLDLLLSAFGWPRVPLMFQLIRHGVFLGEDEFRRLVYQLPSP